MREVSLLEFLEIADSLSLAPLHRASNVRHVWEDFVLASGIGTVLIILVKAVQVIVGHHIYAVVEAKAVLAVSICSCLCLLLL